MSYLKKCCLFLAVLLAIVFNFTPLLAEPEELSQSQIRPELMQKEDEVVKFLKKASEDLNQKLQADFSAGAVNPQDMGAVKKALAKHTKDIFAKAAKLRKTLNEPEERLKLDMEMISLAAQSGLIDQLVKIINNWAGEIKGIMIVTAAQRLQLMKVDFTPEFDALLNEAKNSKDAEIAKVAGRMLNEFFRNPDGKAFPDFPAGAKTTDGKDLTLERFKGKVLLVDFWATWCPPCRAEIPNLVAAYNKYHDKGFEIIGISFDESREKFDEYLKENKLTWPQYFDGLGWQNKIGPTYGIQSIPTMYLLDKEGKVISNDLRNGKLEKHLEEILK
jgi:thiol-disulfide isomerase/thioredoxin